MKTMKKTKKLIISTMCINGCKSNGIDIRRYSRMYYAGISVILNKIPDKSTRE